MVARADRHTHRALTKGKRGKNEHAHASWKISFRVGGTSRRASPTRTGFLDVLN